MNMHLDGKGAHILTLVIQILQACFVFEDGLVTESVGSCVPKKKKLFHIDNQKSYFLQVLVCECVFSSCLKLRGVYSMLRQDPYSTVIATTAPKSVTKKCNGAICHLL